MDREDLKLIPLATLGLAIGIAEVFVRPFIRDRAEEIKHVAQASVQYYSTFEDDREA